MDIDNENYYYITAGYDITLSLLHNKKYIDKDGEEKIRYTAISFDPQRYNALYNWLSTDQDLQVFYSQCFNSADVNWRFTVSLDLDLGIDFAAYILDWSNLFSLELEESYFFLQFLNDIEGRVTLHVEVDMLFTQLSQLALDALITLSDEGGEIFALNFMGNLHLPNFAVTGPQLFLEMPGLADNAKGLLLDAAVFETWLTLDLMPLIRGFMGEDGDEGENGPENAEGEEPVAEEEDDPFWGKPSGQHRVHEGRNLHYRRPVGHPHHTYPAAWLPFDDVGRISLKLDNVNNTLTLNFALDYQPEIDVTAINFDNVKKMSVYWLVDRLEQFDPAFPIFNSTLYSAYIGRNRYVVYAVYDYPYLADQANGFAQYVKYITDLTKAGYIVIDTGANYTQLENSALGVAVTVVRLQGDNKLIVAAAERVGRAAAHLRPADPHAFAAPAAGRCAGAQFLPHRPRKVDGHRLPRIRKGHISCTARM